jgi:hypothetical protein
MVVRGTLFEAQTRGTAPVRLPARIGVSQACQRWAAFQKRPAVTGKSLFFPGGTTPTPPFIWTRFERGPLHACDHTEVAPPEQGSEAVGPGGRRDRPGGPVTSMKARGWRRCLLDLELDLGRAFHHRDNVLLAE